MLETRIAKELAYISQAGLARRITELYFVNPAQAQDRTGKTYLVLASNNYLGFTHASGLSRHLLNVALYRSSSVYLPFFSLLK